MPRIYFTLGNQKHLGAFPQTHLPHLTTFNLLLRSVLQSLLGVYFTSPTHTKSIIRSRADVSPFSHNPLSKTDT